MCDSYYAKLEQNQYAMRNISINKHTQQITRVYKDVMMGSKNKKAFTSFNALSNLTIWGTEEPFFKGSVTLISACLGS